METISKDKVIRILSQKGVSLFTISDARKLFGFRKENTLYKLLQRLEKASIIKRVLGGKYLFTLKEVSDFELANFLVTPSYVSLESVLSFYGILSQFPYTITSVTTGKSKKIIHEDKEYEFVHIDPQYFFGFVKHDNFMIASPEKALLDELYYYTKGLRGISLEELDLTKIDRTKLKAMLKRYRFLPLKKVMEKIC